MDIGTYLSENHVAFERHEHPPAYTAQQVAAERDSVSQALSAQVQALAVEIASKVAGRQIGAGGQA